MKKLLICFILFTCSSVLCQSLTVELIADETGEVISVITKRYRQEVWASMLLRGTHGRNYIPFVDSLYSKYFWRVTKDSQGKRDTIPPAGMNFRQHQESSTSIVKAYDAKKLDYKTNLAQTRSDILDTVIADSIKNDEVEDVLETERWQWGTKGRKIFITYLFEDFTQSKLDSMIDGDWTWKIDPLFWRDSVVVCGESLKNLTWQGLDDCVSTTTKERQWVIAKVVDPLADFLGVTRGQAAQTTIWLTMKNHPRKFSNLIYRTPKFRKYVARWIKRQ